jgi:hypothetical protein
MLLGLGRMVRGGQVEEIVVEIETKDEGTKTKHCQKISSIETTPIQRCSMIADAPALQ